MILDNDILHAVLEEIAKRDCRIFHACQLKDFESYLKLDGIPSRRVLHRQSHPYTKFDTDDQDKQNNVFDKVFFNLQDFGNTFAKNLSATPTVYGPINLVFGPAILANSKDMAICLRSAGAIGFDRKQEGLSHSELQQMFVNQKLENTTKDRWIKWTSDLKELFPKKTVTSWPEISCTIEGGVAPFAGNLRYILVDPYTFAGKSLKSYVEDLGGNLKVKVIERSTDFKDDYQFLWDQVSNGAKLFSSLNQMSELPKNVQDFLGSISSSELEYQFDRYTDYLERGTINYLKSGQTEVG